MNYLWQLTGHLTRGFKLYIKDTDFNTYGMKESLNLCLNCPVDYLYRKFIMVISLIKGRSTLSPEDHHCMHCNISMLQNFYRARQKKIGSPSFKNYFIILVIGTNSKATELRHDLQQHAFNLPSPFVGRSERGIEERAECQSRNFLLSFLSQAQSLTKESLLLNIVIYMGHKENLQRYQEREIYRSLQQTDNSTSKVMMKEFVHFACIFGHQNH